MTRTGNGVMELTARQRRVVLAVVAVSLMAVISAVSGLNVALPSMARDTGATQTQLTWIVDSYTVVFAGLLLMPRGPVSSPRPPTRARRRSPPR